MKLGVNLGYLIPGLALGSAVFQMPTRSPGMTAMTEATINMLSGAVVLMALARERVEGVGTLTIGPMAWTTEERVEQLRAVAELAA